MSIQSTSSINFVNVSAVIGLCVRKGEQMKLIFFSVKFTKWTSFEKDRNDWRDTKWASFTENSDDWTPGIGQTLLVESFWLEDS